MRDFRLPQHPLLALAVAPMLGGLFVVFLPLVGFWLLGRLLWQRAIELNRHLEAAHIA